MLKIPLNSKVVMQQNLMGGGSNSLRWLWQKKWEVSMRGWLKPGRSIFKLMQPSSTTSQTSSKRCSMGLTLAIMSRMGIVSGATHKKGLQVQKMDCQEKCIEIPLQDSLGKAPMIFTLQEAVWDTSVKGLSEGGLLWKFCMKNLKAR